VAVETEEPAEAGGPILYQASFETVPGPEWRHAQPIPDPLIPANHVLRSLPEGPEVTLSLPPTHAAAGGAWSAFEFSMRFRLGQAPAVRQGEGGLFKLTVGGKDSGVSFLVQAAYLRGGSWYFNGLGLRAPPGKPTEWASVELAEGPATTSSGYPIDTEWHQLRVRCRPARLEIRWDGRRVFAAEDARLAFSALGLGIRPTEAKFGWLDVDDVTVRPLAPAGR
jgi:hypothetical protein